MAMYKAVMEFYNLWDERILAAGVSWRRINPGTMRALCALCAYTPTLYPLYLDYGTNNALNTNYFLNNAQIMHESCMQTR
jgi:hypothetical protein